LEIISLGLTTIWFAFGALVAFIAALLNASLAVQIILFILVSVATLIVARPWAEKYLNKNTIKTNVETMQGKTGVVTEEINNIKAQGHISVDGMDWTARSEDDNCVIPEGQVVTVIKIEGVKAIVK
jgi:membrane protein implicated in regulation of membrane protease activity